jgi:HD-GYP domain-containing protein (c-di-GMP phosphodiesterase class II)
VIETFSRDADERRKEIVWLALGLLAALALALFVVLRLGYQVPRRSYDESVVVVGLVILLGCAIAYFAGKEKEQRHLNQSLVHSLQGAVRELNDRVSRLDELTRANGELNEALDRLQHELDQSYLGTLSVLMKTLDARDDYTALHGGEVTTLAAAIAERMGLEKSLVEIINRFGPLHDIGKIGIPDRILRETGPLTADEAALVCEHPVMGATIIAPLRPRPQAIAMLRSHHERWDGRGYPDGLAGEAIPLLARILCVADAYHAMISERPHQSARKRKQAVREIVANAGSQFDPHVAGVLAALESEGALNAQGAC